MRRRFPVIIPVLVLLAALFLGSNMLGRNTRQGDNGTNQQGRNFIGQNMFGVTPNPGLTRIRADVAATPGTGTNVRPEIKEQIGFDRQKADNIRDRLGDIVGIRQINAIVYDNTALIGYSPTGKATNANTTREMITDRVKQLDNTITNVIVSDSAEISSRIRSLVDKINTSKPMNDLNSEFNRLIQNIKSGGL